MTYFDCILQDRFFFQGKLIKNSPQNNSQEVKQADLVGN